MASLDSLAVVAIYALSMLSLLLLVLVVRLWRILPGLSGQSTATLLLQQRACRTAILLGSGGHTTEMLSLLGCLPETDYTPRVYFITDGDTLSETRLRQHETQRKQRYGFDYTIQWLPRARAVGQSFWTAPFSVLKTAIVALQIFWRDPPDLMLFNGPGTCVPLCAILVLYRALGICHTRTLYVESFARTRTISLTGRILYPIVDQFVVQWPALQKQYPRAIYRGILV